MNKPGFDSSGYLNVWAGMILLMVLTTIFILPALFVLVFAFSYDGWGEEHAKFAAIIGTTGWNLWVMFLFFIPTLQSLSKRANGVMFNRASMSLKEVVHLVLQGALNAIPFYLPDPDSR